VFRLAFLFHEDLDLFRRTLPRTIDALTAGTAEEFEIVVHADGTSAGTARELLEVCFEAGVDEVRVRRRERFVASGDPSNNGHRRLVDTRTRYLVVVEDDVVVFRTESVFDPLSAMRALFERHEDVVVFSTVADHEKWTWRLEDLGPEVEAGVRSTNRLSTHLIGYDTHRFVPVAARFAAFDLDVFIDREDLSYNWEDLVSHVGTTGGRRIAFADGWPLAVYHCDEKIQDGSMHHTRDPLVKSRVLTELEARYLPTKSEPAAAPGAPS